MFDFFDFFDLFTLRFWFKLARFALFCSVVGMLTGFVTGNHDLTMYSGIVFGVSLFLVIADVVFHCAD